MNSRKLHFESILFEGLLSTAILKIIVISQSEPRYVQNTYSKSREILTENFSIHANTFQKLEFKFEDSINIT